MRWLLPLALSMSCTGCMLPSMNREGLQLVVNDVKAARKGNEVIATKLNAVVVELNTAAAQERPPVVAPIIAEITLAVAATTESLDEAGKTAVTLQSGIGTPADGAQLPATPDQKQMWRMRYVAMAKVFAKIKTWFQSKLPIPVGVASNIPAPWSGMDISLLITAITTGLGAVGVGGKKVNTWRKGAVEGQVIAGKLKEKCTGDEEFPTMMQDAPTLVKLHRKGKVNAI